MKNIENPWDNYDLVKKVQDYKHYYENKSDDSALKNFTWIVDEDKKILKRNFEADFYKEGSSEKKVCDKSMDWGIPNQVIGDYKKANFFLCLLNPRTRNSADKKENKKVITHGSKGCKTLGEYIHAENEEEIYRVSNRTEYFDTKDGYSKHIINTNMNILNKELSDLKKDDSKKIDSKKYYYLHSYYNFLLREEKESEQKLLSKYSANGDRIASDYNVCNLELVPYRSNDGKGIVFAKKNGKNGSYSFEDLSTSRKELVADNAFYQQIYQTQKAREEGLS